MTTREPMRTGAAWFSVASAIALSALLVRHAWVCDDAYITFRTLDNFVHGFGLVWNPGERVQSFTHPLWLFLHVPFYLLVERVFLITTVLSLGLSLAAFVLAQTRLRASSFAPAGALLVALMSSKSFLDFSASGLENPMTFLLLALFARLLLAQDEAPSTLTPAITVVGLATLNRMDTVLLFLPSLLLLGVRHPPKSFLRALGFGLSPFLAWEAFSLFYFGFPFPNTKYAKLSADIGWQAYAEQGGRYLADLGMHDPSGAAILVVLLASTSGALLLRLLRRRVATPRHLSLAALGAGGGLYIVYVVMVGGDFMSGRFWSAPIFLGSVVGAFWLAELPRRRGALAGILGAVILVVARLAARSPVGHPNPTGIVDARVNWAATNSLLANIGEDRAVTHPQAKQGLALRKIARERAGKPSVFISGIAVGMQGYYAGPDVTIIDYVGLCDPLLARLPVYDPDSWAPGHLVRELPTGYYLARLSGSLEDMDPDLAAYYRKLHLVVSGPLFSAERVQAVLAFNLGKYNDLLGRYLRVKRMGPFPLAAFDAPPRDGAAWNAPGTLVVPTRREVVIRVDPPREAQFLELGANAVNEYQVRFQRNGVVVGSATAPAVAASGAVLRTRRVLVPQGGDGPFDTLVIRPMQRRPWTALASEHAAPWDPSVSSDYSIGHLRLL